MLVGGAGVAWYDSLSNLLKRAMVVAPSANPTLEGFWKDFVSIASKKSFILLICQGAFASSGLAATNFLIEIFQYAGYQDFQASTLVGWMAVGNVVGALGTGHLADECAKRDPATGRIKFGTVGNLCILALLLGLALGDTEEMLNTRHYYALGAVCFLLGMFQLFAYVGAVKPILSEIVPRRVAGQTLAYAAGIDGAIAAVAGAPVVALISQSVFGYQPTELEISDMPTELRKNNLVALTGAFFVVCFTGMLLATVFFALLGQTYETDRQESRHENGEDDEMTLLANKKLGDPMAL